MEYVIHEAVDALAWGSFKGAVKKNCTNSHKKRNFFCGCLCNFFFHRPLVLLVRASMDSETNLTNFKVLIGGWSKHSWWSYHGRLFPKFKFQLVGSVTGCHVTVWYAVPGSKGRWTTVTPREWSDNVCTGVIWQCLYWQWTYGQRLGDRLTYRSTTSWHFKFHNQTLRFASLFNTTQSDRALLIMTPEILAKRPPRALVLFVVSGSGSFSQKNEIWNFQLFFFWGLLTHTQTA